MTRSVGLAAAAVSAVALLTGCGSSAGNHSSSTSASTAASTPTTRVAAARSNPAGITVQTKRSKLGTILAAGPKRLTVYMFEADKSSTSACSGACTKVWPPVTTGAAPSAAGAAVNADLGTIARADGTKQVTYKGHPLYFFKQDGDASDAYGEGSSSFGAGWYVLKASGVKVDKS